METYIILGNFTQEGVSNIKERPARIEAARKAVEAAGGKFLSWHLTMGRYDFVAITEAADAKGTPTVYWLTQDFNEAGRRLYDRVGKLTPFIKYTR